jgi:hypothetical protein
MKSRDFLTSHARVLLRIAREPGVRLRDIAASLGITERSTYGIVADLAAVGYVVKQEDGRRSRYQIQAHLPLPETTSQQPAIGEVPALLAGTSARLPVTRTRPARGHRSRAAYTHRAGAARPASSGQVGVLVLYEPPKSYDNWPTALAAAGYQGQTGPQLAKVRRGCHRISSAFMCHPRSPDATHAAAGRHPGGPAQITPIGAPPASQPGKTPAAPNGGDARLI